MGLYDQIQRKIEEHEGGISPLDLATLSPMLRKIMRFMLREVELTYSEICQHVESFPQADQISRADLDVALADLTKQQWLIKRGEEVVSYKVNLRRKAGSTLHNNIWNTLDTRIQSPPEEGETPAE